MTPPAHPYGARPVEGSRLRGWLLGRLGLYLDRPAGDIDALVPLDEYGLDSIGALSLCCDLEEEFGLETDRTLLWDHPTVRSLLEHLESVLSTAAVEHRG